jgi:hypothetical protein
MLPSRFALLIFGYSCLPLCIGCAPSNANNNSRHYGPKVNIRDFMTNTAAYKNRSVTLALRVDELIDRQQGQTLRDFVGRDVKFVGLGPKGEHLNVVINIPDGLSVPGVCHEDEVSVTFLCSLGSLARGNVAQVIAAASGVDGM